MNFLSFILQPASVHIASVLKSSTISTFSRLKRVSRVRVSLCMRRRPRPSTVQPTTSECICTGLKEAGRLKNQLRSEELRSTESRGRVPCPYLINESVATEVTSPTPLLRRRECSHSVSHSIVVFLANAAKPHQPIEGQQSAQRHDIVSIRRHIVIHQPSRSEQTR